MPTLTGEILVALAIVAHAFHNRMLPNPILTIAAWIITVLTLLALVIAIF